MDGAGIGYRQQDNCFPWVADWERAQQLMNTQLKANWPELLDGIARLLNPIHDEDLPPLPDPESPVHVPERVGDRRRISRALQDLRRLYPLFVRHAMTTPAVRTCCASWGSSDPAVLGVVWFLGLPLRSQLRVALGAQRAEGPAILPAHGQRPGVGRTCARRTEGPAILPAHGQRPGVGRTFARAHGRTSHSPSPRATPWGRQNLCAAHGPTGRRPSHSPSPRATPWGRENICAAHGPTGQRFFRRTAGPLGRQTTLRRDSAPRVRPCTTAHQPARNTGGATATQPEYSTTIAPPGPPGPSGGRVRTAQGASRGRASSRRLS